MKTMQQLLDTLPQQGKVGWVGLRPARRAEMIPVNEVLANTGSGLQGDRYKGRTGDRQVTLIQAEHLPVIAACVGLPVVTPGQLRRNILVSGINLLALKNRTIAVAGAVLEVTGLCHPCSRMEEVLGSGGYNAMRGHGGVTARVIEGGVITVGGPVVAVVG